MLLIEVPRRSNVVFREIRVVRFLHPGDIPVIELKIADDGPDGDTGTDHGLVPLVGPLRYVDAFTPLDSHTLTPVLVPPRDLVLVQALVEVQALEDELHCSGDERCILL